MFKEESRKLKGSKEVLKVQSAFAYSLQHVSANNNVNKTFARNFRIIDFKYRQSVVELSYYHFIESIPNIRFSKGSIEFPN